MSVLVNYKPALTEEENARIDQLMAKLKKIQDAEEVTKKELRQLIYKVERMR